jgi:hypothetical protein
VHLGSFYVYSIVPPPHHTTITNLANIPSIVGAFSPYTYMEGIWVLKPWSNSFFDAVTAYF